MRIKKNLYPLVSIIMNCHNCRDFLKDSLNSVVNQTYDNWELIFLDNCSSDDSKNILLNFKDNRVKYFKTDKFFTLGEARKLAWKQCNGEYVAFLDSDDISKSFRLKEQINFFQNHKNIAVYGSGIEVIDIKGKVITQIYCPTESQNLKDELKISFPFMNSTLMINKKMGDDCGGLDETYEIIHDHDFIYRISKKYDVANSNLIFSQWRKHNNNLSWKKMLKGQKELSRFLLTASKEIENKNIYFKNREARALNFLKLTYLFFIEKKFLISLSYFFKSMFLTPKPIFINNKTKKFFIFFKNL